MEYNVMHFGAAGDGAADDTRAIQSAIDACRISGGGKVVFPGGRVYRSGALVLCSNLELHLEMGAVLKGSDSLADYALFGSQASLRQTLDAPSYENSEYDGAPGLYFLYGRDCENLAITGLGKIDGNEELFYGKVTKWHIDGIVYPRAPMLFLEHCQQVTLLNVTFQHSAFWTVHLVGCQDVRIDGIRILNSLRMANCDGIDPDHCRNVRITNCHIECADDCIVFKNTEAAAKYGPCENITVSNCTLISTSAAIKIGSESEGLFRSILVENCAISRSNRGISLQLRDSGTIENVLFHNITAETRLFHPEMYWGSGEPVAITVLPRKPETRTGVVRNVHFSNCFFTGENGLLLYGHGAGDICGITFSHVCLNLRQASRYEKGFHDLRPTCGASAAPKGLHYLLAHNADDVSFQSCRFCADPFMEAALDAPFATGSAQAVRMEGELL